MKTLVSTLCLAALVLCTAGRAADSSADIVATLKADPRFKILSAALDDVQLSEALKLSSSITFFAPTDDAFHKLPELNVLLADKTRLKSTLARHFVADHKILAADLAKTNVLAMSDGTTLRIGEDGKRIHDSHVIAADIPAGNGVIHAIDTVIQIPQVAGAPVITEVQINDTAATTTPDNRFTESKNSFKDAGHTIGNGVKSSAETVGDGVKTGAEKVGDGAKSGAETVGDGLKTGASKIKHAFGF